MASVDNGLIIFPAIDLKGGQVVRLAEGDMGRATVYGDNPAAQAELFANAGAEWLHVVDLDGAFAGESVNGAAVAAILESGFGGHIQLGGGIRNRESIDRWLDLGVQRVVIGTAALENPDLVREAARDNPGRIVVAVDARDGLVATRGWADVSDVAVVDLARRFEDAGVAALLFTDVGRDGLLKGCNVEATVALARAVSIPVIASGGVTDIADIHALRPHVEDGVEGVITGRALYDGRLDLAWAIEVGRTWISTNAAVSIWSSASAASAPASTNISSPGSRTRPAASSRICRNPTNPMTRRSRPRPSSNGPHSRRMPARSPACRSRGWKTCCRPPAAPRPRSSGYSSRATR